MSLENGIIIIGLLASIVGHIFGALDRRNMLREQQKIAKEPLEIHLFMVVDPTGVKEPTVQVYRNHDYR